MWLCRQGAKTKSVTLLIVFLSVTPSGCFDGGDGGGGDSEPPTDCADYPEATTSEYVLPYPVGESYVVSQANCGAISHHPQPGGGDLTYAYDFKMAIGTEVVTSRSGMVWGIKENVPDGTGDWSNIDHVIIEHADNTYGRYFHLKQNGALVNRGDVVLRGQVIALSGNTGIPSTPKIPHLHFDVMKENPDGTFNLTIPITFHNADPPAPTSTGLNEGVSYTALDY